ncbi:MAG TPA: GLPGLI family protein [Saprospiraceae bacterium]|nr:GLPGLI family protein [Saprospiraceae bacterium]HMP23956.1 GLPGLI family protein [Saprospiraceae bacterium]
MKRFILYNICFLISTNALLAQAIHSKVSYLCTTKLAKGPVHDGLNTLYFTQDKGLFIHHNYPKEDAYLTKGNVMIFMQGDPEGLPVFMNLKEQFLYYKSTYGLANGSFILREDLPDIQWKILSENKKIEQFNCIKAVGDFGGRTYDVWFTPDIPVRLGPYKLWGLPGMILEAKSKDGRVSYEFKSYESPIRDEVKIEKPNVGQEVSWEEYNAHIINKLLRTESLSNDQYRATNNDPDPNYEIEYNKHTVISEYKKQRATNQRRN